MRWKSLQCARKYVLFSTQYGDSSTGMPRGQCARNVRDGVVFANAQKVAGRDPGAGAESIYMTYNDYDPTGEIPSLLAPPALRLQRGLCSGPPIAKPHKLVRIGAIKYTHAWKANPKFYLYWRNISDGRAPDGAQ